MTPILNAKDEQYLYLPLDIRQVTSDGPNKAIDYANDVYVGFI